jgi:hypothetical protein
MQNTGIYLNEGDLYSILATGSIDYYKRFIKRPEDGTAFMARIGRKNRFFFPLSVGHNASTRRSYDSGNLYVGYKLGGVDRYGEPLQSEHYSLNEGSFSVDIIVWKREDYEGIADLLGKLKEKDPKNKALIHALDDAIRQKGIYLARAKASKELEETKKEIQKVKEEPVKQKGKAIKAAPEEKATPQAKPPPVESVKDEKVARLEARLSELTETLNRLEEMKEQLEEVKRETSLLTKELSEQDRREKDLLTRLEKAEKIPPVIVVVAPKDDIEVAVATINFSGVVQDDQGVKGVDIFINKNPLLAKVSGDIKLSKRRHPRRLEFAERIALQRGKNEIRIRVTDTDGLSAEKVLTVRYRETRKNVWAVVIGINRYQKTRHLKYAVNDARAFYDHLIHNNRIPEENVTLMLNEEARLTRMRSILGTHLKNKAGKGDMVIIYFAGHGACEKDVMSPDKDGLEKYILPYNADPKDLYASALPMREMSHI